MNSRVQVQDQKDTEYRLKLLVLTYSEYNYMYNQGLTTRVTASQEKPGKNIVMIKH